MFPYCWWALAEPLFLPSREIQSPERKQLSETAVAKPQVGRKPGTEPGPCLGTSAEGLFPC